MGSLAHILSILTFCCIVQSLFAFSPYLDLHSKPHINVVLLAGSNPNESVLESQVDDLLAEKNTQLMRLENDTYICTLPDISMMNKTSDEDSMSINENGTSITEHELAVSQAQNRSMELLEPLKTNCIYYMKGYWLYELCHGAHVLQYHPTTGFVVPEPGTPVFTLGTLNNTDGSTKVQTTDGVQYHVSQLYTNGSTCDLTSDNRTVEVQYSCDASLETTKITSISEKKTCHYLMTVHTPLLCEEHIFNQKDDSYQVTCKMVVSSFENVSDDSGEKPLSSKSMPTDNVAVSSIGGNLVLSVADISSLLPKNIPTDSTSEDLLKATTSMVADSLADGSFHVDGRVVGLNDNFFTVLRVVNNEDLPVARVSVSYENGILDVRMIEQEEGEEIDINLEDDDAERSEKNGIDEQEEDIDGPEGQDTYGRDHDISEQEQVINGQEKDSNNQEQDMNVQEQNIDRQDHDLDHDINKQTKDKQPATHFTSILHDEL